jgi:hypothetical protein
VVAISADRGSAYVQRGLSPHNTSSSCKYCYVAWPRDCDAILDVPVLSGVFVGALQIQRESKQQFRHVRVFRRGYILLKHLLYFACSAGLLTRA